MSRPPGGRDTTAPMRDSRPVLVGALLLSGLLNLASTTPAGAQGEGGFEAPPVFVPKEALPKTLVASPHYRVDGYVYNDGVNNKYQLTTDYGPVTVVTTDLLVTRVHEMATARRLDRIRRTGAYNDALGAAERGPLAGMKALLARPLTGAASTQVRSFLAPVAPAPLRPPPGKEELFLAATTDFAAARRKLAFAVDVDPYSSFGPLQERLADLAWLAVAGGLTVEKALAAIGEKPASTHRTLREPAASLVRDQPRAALKRLGREKLTAMGVNESVVRVFVDHPRYTPTMLARIVAALESMNGVEGRHVFVEGAALAQDTAGAAAIARRAELMASYHANVAPVARFVRLGNGIFLQKADGSVVGIFAGDYVVWTRPVSQAESAISASINRLPSRGDRELWFSRRVSSAARSELEKRGWRVSDNAGDRFAPR